MLKDVTAGLRLSQDGDHEESKDASRETGFRHAFTGTFLPVPTGSYSLFPSFSALELDTRYESFAPPSLFDQYLIIPFPGLLPDFRLSNKHQGFSE
jgi:hypothetical protein